MWAIRILKGPQAGQVIQVTKNDITLGRSEDCDVCIKDSGISKKHARITNFGNQMSVTDLNSSNGTFVNGVRIKTRIVNPGDKISLYNVICDVIPEGQMQAQVTNVLPFVHGNLAQQIPTVSTGHQSPTHPHVAAAPEQAPDPVPKKTPATLWESIRQYVDNIAMPGVYKLGSHFEFRFVIGGFVAAFVLVVTLLSLFPMVTITKSSIEKESQRSALNIARHLADYNQPLLQSGQEGNVTTQMAEHNEGVQVALIVSNTDGHIIAPNSKWGSYANFPFVYSVRKTSKPQVKQVESGLVGASVPIYTFNQEQGTQVITAYAIVLYDMGSLAVDDGRTLGLFIQSLAIALLIGFVLYYLMYRFIEYPIVDLSEQVDRALKENRDGVDTLYDFPAMKTLALNISASLSRAVHGNSQQQLASTAPTDKSTEAGNLVQMIGWGALAVNSDHMIMAVNPKFEEISGMRIATVQGQSLEILQDQALKLSIQDLIQRCTSQPNLIATNQLDISGQNHELDSQAVKGPSSIEYFIISIKPTGDLG